jgi:hypothetical protein
MSIAPAAPGALAAGTNDNFFRLHVADVATAIAVDLLPPRACTAHAQNIHKIKFVGR